MQAKIWNFSQWIQETNPQIIRQKFDIQLKLAGFNVLCFLDHNFKPQGYTALWLLTESHFAVHTFPEYKKSYIELSSCNLEFFQNFLKQTKEL
jgi:S-adenosylmethionine decarboxylase